MWQTSLSQAEGAGRALAVRRMHHSSGQHNVGTAAPLPKEQQPPPFPHREEAAQGDDEQGQDHVVAGGHQRVTLLAVRAHQARRRVGLGVAHNLLA